MRSCAWYHMQHSRYHSFRNWSICSICVKRLDLLMGNKLQTTTWWYSLRFHLRETTCSLMQHPKYPKGIPHLAGCERSLNMVTPTVREVNVRPREIEEQSPKQSQTPFDCGVIDINMHSHINVVFGGSWDWNDDERKIQSRKGCRVQMWEEAHVDDRRIHRTGIHVFYNRIP